MARQVKPVTVDVGEPQLRAGVALPDDDPHALRPALQAEHAGDLGNPGTGPDLPVAVTSRVQAQAGILRTASWMSSLWVKPTE
jgi:hypothetical protein